MYSLAESSGYDAPPSFRIEGCHNPTRSLSDQLLPFEDGETTDDGRQKPTATPTAFQFAAYRSPEPHQEPRPPATRRRSAGLKRTHATVTGLSDLTDHDGDDHDIVASSRVAFPREARDVSRSSSWGQFVDVVGAHSGEKRRRVKTAARRPIPTEKFVALDLS